MQVKILMINTLILQFYIQKIGYFVNLALQDDEKLTFTMRKVSKNYPYLKGLFATSDGISIHQMGMQIFL
jgi:hypothetical protein